jgi:hypothetical protein
VFLSGASLTYILLNNVLTNILVHHEGTMDMFELHMCICVPVYGSELVYRVMHLGMVEIKIVCKQSHK